MVTPRPVQPVHEPHPILDAYYSDSTGKRSFLSAIFDRTAVDYDRVDRLLAFGTGSWYRRQALLRAGLTAGMQVLDVGVGTGLVAREIRRVVGANGHVIGIDPSAGMMTLARAKEISLIQGRAEVLPFADASFDFLTLGFALRHVSDLERVFAEFRRVLRPGGKTLLLEITRPSGPIAHALMRTYMRRIVPFLSRAIARDSETPRLYRYYWDTIETCAPPESVMATLRAAGFRNVDRHVEIGLFSEYRAIA